MQSQTRTRRTHAGQRRRVGPAGERGQLLMLFVFVFAVVALAGAISVDVGFWLSERRGISRATDLAALAAVQDLPESRTKALATAYDFAERNGYGEDDEGTTVEVTFYCGNSIPNPPAGICNNPLAPFLSVCNLQVGCDAVEVKIRKPARGFFTSVFGADHVHVAYLSLANVKFNMTPIDTSLVLDATSSMGWNAPGNSCHQGSGSGRVYDPNKDGCPIKEARDAANRFVNILLDGTSALTRVGYVPYRGCFNPTVTDVWPPTAPPQGVGPWPQGEPNPCVRDSVINGIANVTNLTASDATLRTEINQTRADVPGSGTNTCWALRRAHEQLNASTQTGNVERFVVLLADGNNVFYDRTSPPNSGTLGSCRAELSGNDPDLTSGCNPTFDREGRLDELTWARAKALQDAGVEVYVVGFGVCGTYPSAGGSAACKGPDSDLNICTTVTDGTCESLIGDVGGGSNQHDNTADRRLLKCLATSEDGTNDHYFEVQDADDLPSIFQVIAFEIASRSLSEDGQ